MKGHLFVAICLTIPTLAYAEGFSDCSQWLSDNSELRSVGKKRGGMIGINYDGDVDILRPDLLASSSNEGNTSIYKSAILPKIQAVIDNPANSNLKGKVEARDQVTIQRDSSQRIIKVIINRAIQNFEDIQGTAVSAYHHIQEISFAYDQAGCYPESRTTYRKVGNITEPDGSETFAFNKCVDLQRIKDQIGFDQVPSDEGPRLVLKLPEEPLCRRLLAAYSIAENIRGSATLRRQGNLCSDSTYTNDGKNRREALNELVGNNLQCRTVTSFVSPRLETRSRSISGSSSPSVQGQ